MSKKYIISLIIIVAVISLFAFGSKKNRTPIENTSKPQVVTSFYPLYFFASMIGGDKVSISNITPEGIEPHEYEPTPKDLIAIENSQILVLNGADLEPWGEDVLKNIDTKNKIVVLASDGLATLESQEHEEDADHEENASVIDPHVWLSPVLAQKMVDKIEQGFISADPANASYYASNAKDLKARLSNLDTQYKQELNKCVSRDIITSHAAFGYLALAYNLKQIPIAGLSTEEEPSTKELADVADFANKNNVKYIFFESLISPKLSQTIAKEVGAQTLVLNPIEGLTKEETDLNKDYFSEMQENLNNLKIALQCTQ